MRNKIEAYKHIVKLYEKELEFHYSNLDKTDDFGVKTKIFTKIDWLEFQIESLTKDIQRWEGVDII